MLAASAIPSLCLFICGSNYTPSGSNWFPPRFSSSGKKSQAFVTQARLLGSWKWEMTVGCRTVPRLWVQNCGGLWGTCQWRKGKPVCRDHPSDFLSSLFGKWKLGLLIAKQHLDFKEARSNLLLLGGTWLGQWSEERRTQSLWVREGALATCVTHPGKSPQWRMRENRVPHWQKQFFLLSKTSYCLCWMNSLISEDWR